eukprot:COSAG01_NODE_8056_length_2937_cov_3.940099_2_plen_68_part_00
MSTTLMEGRLGSLDIQSEAGAGGMGAGAAQGGHIWRVCKASSAPLCKAPSIPKTSVGLAGGCTPTFS